MSHGVTPPHPEKFLEVRCQQYEAEPWLVAMCAGYELGEWRGEQLAEHVMEWLPEFALKYSEWKSLGPGNAVKLIKKAAKAIYKTEKYGSRGEFGELLLHIVIRHVFRTFPAISKIHYKDSRNDTVKGFDCVHTIAKEDKLELWLGEVKFYKDIGSAIRDVIKELNDHTKRDYLRDEFSAITNKIDKSWPSSDKLSKLLDNNTSLDEIFDSVTIPVLLSYDSGTVNSYDRVTDDFKRDFASEVNEHWNTFRSKNLPKSVNIVLILLPLKSKKDLQDKLHGELQRWN
ncbi:DUF1837 domain-containing protein [Halopseudomonas sp. Lyrl_26]|uniref:HamA C-terminal domain-containing protein n=1 Tax=Halopseudomonas sp. Lyrl_26 TaxID=3110923 RepID=UPI003F7D43CF